MNERVIDKTPKLQYYNKGIFFNYNIEYTRYYNEHTKSINECEHLDFFMIQLTPKWFSIENIYYDGYQLKEFVIFGIGFGKGHSYDWKDLEIQE